VALFGIVMDGDEAHAVIRAGAVDKIVRVRVGDDIGGWKVAQIDERRLILSLDDRIATFMMFSGNSANGAPRTDREMQSADRQSQSQTQPQNQARQNDPAVPDPQPPGARKPHRPR
jgi:general secretion pathway protein N